MENFFNDLISIFSSSSPSFSFEWLSFSPQSQEKIKNEILLKLQQYFQEKTVNSINLSGNDNTNNYYTQLQISPVPCQMNSTMKAIFERVIDYIDDLETLAECAMVCRTFRDIVVAVRKQVVPMCQLEYYILNCRRLNLVFPTSIKLEIFHTFTEDNSVVEEVPSSLGIIDLSDYYNEEKNLTFLPSNTYTSLQSLILPWTDPTPFLKERILSLLNSCPTLMIYFQFKFVNYNLIYWATSRGETEILATALHTFKGRLFVDTAYGETPLCNAAQNGYYEQAKLLLENGASVNLPCISDLKTPLIRAVINSYTNIVALLDQYGADWNLQDMSKKSALDYAELLERNECVQIYRLRNFGRE